MYFTWAFSLLAFVAYSQSATLETPSERALRILPEPRIPTPQNSTPTDDLTPIAPVIFAAQHLPFNEEELEDDEEDDEIIPIQHLPFLDDDGTVPIQGDGTTPIEVPPVVPVIHAAQHLPFHAALEDDDITPTQDDGTTPIEVPPVVPVIEVPPVIPVSHTAQHLPFNDDYPIQPEDEDLEEYSPEEDDELLDYPIEDMFNGDDEIMSFENQDDGTVPISDEESQLENQDIIPIDFFDEDITPISDDDYPIQPKPLCLCC